MSDKIRSPYSDTSIFPPEGVNAEELNKAMKKEGFTPGSGYGKLKDNTFRIGHMGACTLGDLLATFGALEQGLAECGYTPPESGVAAALQAFR